MARSLRLQSTACSLPHPDKVDKGGEDSHFICADAAVGVADGVGGWADVGVDAGQYARELMSNSIAAVRQQEAPSVADPLRALVAAHAATHSRGSSTACILILADNVSRLRLCGCGPAAVTTVRQRLLGPHRALPCWLLALGLPGRAAFLTHLVLSQKLHAANLGDSGFVVIREGRTLFKSPSQQHGFNFPFQLGSDGSDSPQSAQVFEVPVAAGDVLVVGTDGLFDNVYDTELNSVVVHSSRAGSGPAETAQRIAALARVRAADRLRQTPFSRAAQDAGFRYYGGKMDDITVVVSYIGTRP
eukprot:SM000017S02830  [mRNA]  locus=s17:525356:526611:- [translate_table: standard]